MQRLTFVFSCGIMNKKCQGDTTMESKKIWAYLIHLGSNMWTKKGKVASGIRHEEDFTYKDKMFCQKETWTKVTNFLPSCGINTLIIDIGEGVRLDSHPEIAIEGAWSKEELRAELERLRSIGLTPIPKFNFSCGHDAWMGEYAFMVGTKAYYNFCKDIVEETIELFDTPEYFHLGLDEEDYGSQVTNYIAVVRTPAKKTEDALFLFDICRTHGVRPWIWADFDSYGGVEKFSKVVPKDVVISSWHYGFVRDGAAIEDLPESVRMMKTIDDLGYELVPATTTGWGWHLNSKETMLFCKKNITPQNLKGFMVAPWMLTIEKKYYAMINDAYTFYNARKDIFEE